MFDVFIIEKIREEEERRNRERRRPYLEVPIADQEPPPGYDDVESEKSDRGVTIIERD